MKSYNYKFLVFILPTLFLYCSTSAQIANLDTASIKKTHSNATFSDSSTFYNQLYYSSMLGEDFNVYRNFTALVDYKLNYSNDVLPGFKSVTSLLNYPKDSFPLNSSHIRYIKGSKLEQVFDAGFRQRIFNNFSVVGNFRSINSPGFFINQLNKILNYNLGVAYQSSNAKLKMAFNFQPSVVEQQLNGGVKYDSLASGIANNAGKSLEVNLIDAAMKLRNKRLSYILDYKSAANDTTLNPIWFVTTKLDYSQLSYLYNSETVNNTFYSSINYDSTATEDSLFFSSIKYTLLPGLTLKFKDASLSIYNISSVELNKYHYFNSTINYEVFSTGAGIRFLKGRSFTLFQAVINSSDEFESGFDASLNSIIKSKVYPFNLILSSQYKSTFPSPLYENYNSNHFEWNNNFSNTEILNNSLSLVNERSTVNIKASWLWVKDYIFFNSAAVPFQRNDPFSVLQFRSNLRIHLFRKWFLFTDLSIQETENESSYRMPFVYSYASVFHESMIIKNAMRISYGTGCHYYSKFYADAFMPATSQFYIQNNVEVGGYPYIDLFVNFRIKTVDFFLKIENAPSGLIDLDSFYLPNQPTPGRTLKAGIYWNFKDNQPKR